MADRRTSGRVQMKTDTTAHWELASSFIPMKGELIVFSDTNKIKIGDGTTTLANLSYSKAIADVGKTTSTILGTGWTRPAEGHATYAGFNSGDYADKNIVVELAPTASEAQMKAYSKAMLTGSATDNILTALGTAPAVDMDIPVILTVEAK